jgi:glycosyltransferase involved in cell wall biosynthesis
VSVPGRNQPCPCGSGRRYKECHGAISQDDKRAEGTRLLRDALALQQARRLDDARQRYEEALALLPDSADGWHMLGVIDLEQGRLANARDRIIRALDLTEWRIGSMRHNLGLVLGKLDGASQSAGAEGLRARYRAWRGDDESGRTAATHAPLVSVVMPAYNHAAYVERALRSVFEQSYRAIEIIAVDDGSTDSTADRVERCLRDSPFPSRLIRQGNAGAPSALNRGIGAAEGSFVQLLNSDDALAPQRVERIAAATAARGARWGFSAVAVIDDADRPADALADRRAFDLLCETNRVPLCETTGFALLSVNVAISSGNLFLSRSLIDEIGPFADYRYNHDWEYCLRALQRAEPAWVQEPLYRYRLHGANTITESPRAARDEAARVCSAYLRWAIAETAPANPFAPALANWGRSFVNAMLVGGMGELLTADELRQLVDRPTPAASLA